MIECLKNIVKKIKIAFYKNVGRKSESMWSSSVWGRFYVQFPDGNKSVRMYYTQAKNYRDIFGGEIIFIEKP